MNDEDENRCAFTTLATFDGDADELRCVKRAGHKADYYSRTAGTFVPTPTEHRFEFDIEPTEGAPE